MTIFRVAPHPAVVKLRDESRDLASPCNEKSPPAKWYCVMQCLHSFVINKKTPEGAYAGCVGSERITGMLDGNGS